MTPADKLRARKTPCAATLDNVEQATSIYGVETILVSLIVNTVLEQLAQESEDNTQAIKAKVGR